jgi:hypothetical protein
LAIAPNVSYVRKAIRQREQHDHRQQSAGEAQVIRKAEPRAGRLVAYLWI